MNGVLNDIDNSEQQFLFPLSGCSPSSSCSSVDCRHKSFSRSTFPYLLLHFFFWIVVAVAAVAAALVVQVFLFALISSPPVGERVDAVFLDQNSKWNVTCPFLVALCR